LLENGSELLLMREFTVCFCGKMKYMGMFGADSGYLSVKEKQ